MVTVVLCSFFMFHWLVLKLFGGIYLSYQCSTSLALFNERTHCAPFFVASVLLWKGEKSFTKPQSSHYVLDMFIFYSLQKIVKKLVKLHVMLFCRNFSWKVWKHQNSNILTILKVDLSLLSLYPGWICKYWDVAYVIECLGLHGGASPQSSCIKSITIKQLLRAVFENAFDCFEMLCRNPTCVNNVQIET